MQFISNCENREPVESQLQLEMIYIEITDFIIIQRQKHFSWMSTET